MAVNSVNPSKAGDKAQQLRIQQQDAQNQKAQDARAATAKAESAKANQQSSRTGVDMQG
jgi:hypothetical protein